MNPSTVAYIPTRQFSRRAREQVARQRFSELSGAVRDHQARGAGQHSAHDAALYRIVRQLGG